MGQNSDKKKRSIYGHLVATAKARTTKKSVERPPTPVAKKDAWYRNPGWHTFSGEGKLCEYCKKELLVHRSPYECFEEFLMRTRRRD